MKAIRKLDHWLAMLEKTLAVMLFITLAGSIVFNIISRNLFHVSMDKILEFSPSLVLWLALIGSSLALKENRHIKLELFLKIVSPRIRNAAHAVSSVFGMAVMGILCVAAVEFVNNEVSVFGGKGWLSIIFPAFFSLAFFRFFIQLADAAKGIKNI